MKLGPKNIYQMKNNLKERTTNICSKYRHVLSTGPSQPLDLWTTGKPVFSFLFFVFFVGEMKC